MGDKSIEGILVNKWNYMYIMCVYFWEYGVVVYEYL